MLLNVDLQDSTRAVPRENTDLAGNRAAALENFQWHAARLRPNPATTNQRAREPSTASRCWQARKKPKREMTTMQTETFQTRNQHQSRRQSLGRRRYQSFANTRPTASTATGEGAPREASPPIRGELSGAPEEFVRNQGQPNGE
jgi:hypothetical protein